MFYLCPMRLLCLTLLGVTLLPAQLVDVTQMRVDPLTFVFEDGRTSLEDYVKSQLRQHTTCCGVDNIYMELRITPEGRVESVRPMTGRNDCYKQSIRDILQPLLWKVESFRTTRPLYCEFSLQEECKGTESDNVYKPVPLPAGAKPIAQAPTPVPAQPPATQPPAAQPPAPKPEPEPIPVTPSLPGTSEPKTKATEPVEEATAPERAEKPPKPAPAPKPKPQPPTEPEESYAQERPARRPTTEPARKGYQPGKEPPKEAQPPNPPAVLGRLPADSTPVPLKVAVPKGYASTGEKRPPQEHVNSYVNTSGPRFSEPDYISGPIAKALYLKQEYRKRNVCGLVHVLLEVAIDAQGNIRGYRILRANRPDVEIATPQVLAGMKYKPVPMPTVFYTEFKIDVDCDSDQRKLRLDTIPDFLSTPDAKLIRSASPQP